MGAWGPGIFEDDLACDLRDEFADLLADGLTSDEAARRLEESWRPADDPLDLEPPFWIALAAAQHRWGRLTDRVRDEALRVIDAGRDLQRFVEPGHRRARQTHLESLRAALTGPQPKPKPIRRTPEAETAWKVGLVVSYRLPSGRLSLWRVVGHHSDRGGRHAVVEVLEGTHERPPGALGVAFLGPARRLGDGRRNEMIVVGGVEQSPRVSETRLGGSLLAPVARRLRCAAVGPHDVARSIVLADKVDLHLKTLFGYD